MGEEGKWVYDFSEGSKDMRELLGGKGANVAEMTRVLGEEAHSFLVAALAQPLAEFPKAADRALGQADRAIGETLEHHAHLRLRPVGAR